MTVVITGPRDWGTQAERDELRFALMGALQEAGDTPLTVVHGAANGADAIAGAWGGQHPLEVVVKPYRAAWRDTTSPTYNPAKGYDPVAGHRRNQQMIDKHPDAAYVLACRRQGKDWTRGTGDMVRRCLKAGLTVREVVA